MDPFTREEVKKARLAYEEDRRAHKYDQPHWEDISHAEHVHWIFAIRGKNQEPKPLAPQGLVVVVG